MSKNSDQNIDNLLKRRSTRGPAAETARRPFVLPLTVTLLALAGLTGLATPATADINERIEGEWGVPVIAQCGENGQVMQIVDGWMYFPGNGCVARYQRSLAWPVVAAPSILGGVEARVGIGGNNGQEVCIHFELASATLTQPVTLSGRTDQLCTSDVLAHTVSLRGGFLNIFASHNKFTVECVVDVQPVGTGTDCWLDYIMVHVSEPI